jgi:hypothetical protein
MESNKKLNDDKKDKIENSENISIKNNTEKPVNEQKINNTNNSGELNEIKQQLNILLKKLETISPDNNKSNLK